MLPQLRPAIYGGMLLIVLDALVEFDAFVGLKFQTFSFDVYAQYQLGLQRIRRGRALAGFDRALRRAAVRRGARCAATRTTRA